MSYFPNITYPEYLRILVRYGVYIKSPKALALVNKNCRKCHE